MAALTDPMHDFDFEFGDWLVDHHRLRERLTGCQDWDDFTGTTRARPIFGGQGNFEENLMQMPAGPVHAAALRTFDPVSGLWAIWWLAANAPHVMDVPVKGRFEGGVGTFYADDTLRGQPIKVRFQWLDTLTALPRWEQAFSPDGGQSWETNWKMTFRRV
jgi:hypothetical protein